MPTIAELDPNLVTTGEPVEGGCCYVSFDTEKPLPTDATTKMSTLTHFESLGELSNNGYTETKSVDTTEHEGWHGTTIAVTNGKETNNYKAECVEIMRAAVAKLRYGIKNVEANEDGSVKHISGKASGTQYVSLVFDELMSNGLLRRTVVHKAAVTDFDDVAHKRGELMVYGMTFKAIDKAGFFDIYYAKPAASGVGH